MSKYVKRSGLYVLPFLMIGATMIGIRYNAQAEGGVGEQIAWPGGGGEEVQEQPQTVAIRAQPEEFYQPLYIEPIEGLTTRRHKAPPQTSISLGVVVRFAQKIPRGGTLTWTGAREVERQGRVSIAECPLSEVGSQVIIATVEAQFRYENQIVLDVVDVPIEQVSVGPIAPSVEPVDLDEDSTNAETLHYFFDFPSIANLREVGEGQYRTSVDREVLMIVDVDPPGFAPLIEWQIDGDDPFLGGDSRAKAFEDVGMHTISVGPPDRREDIEIETYSVRITSHRSWQDIVPEGEPVTFEAVTDPPGYEDDIAWLSSTLYGTAAPVLGQGPTFTVQFDDTWGWNPTKGNFQWLGVRADDVAFNQDQKRGACCFPPQRGDCGTRPPFCEITTSQDCSNRGGIFLGPKTECTSEVRVNIYGDDPNAKANHVIITVQNCPGIPVGQGGTCVECDGDPKFDPWISAEGEGGVQSTMNFNNFPIPKGFFDDISDPRSSLEFANPVPVRGVALGEVEIDGCPGPLDFGQADTIIRRSEDPFDRCEIPPSFPTVPVEVEIAVEKLNLESCGTLLIEFDDNSSEEWNMKVLVEDSSGQPAGSTLTATKEHCNGGTFDSELEVCPILVFTKVAPPNTELLLDFCEENGAGITMKAMDVPWIHDPGENIELVSPVCTDFHGGVAESDPTTECDCNENQRRDSCEVPESPGCPEGTCEENCLEDCNENCIPDVPNVCEPDRDEDGVIDDCDNCPDDPNPGQEDRDGDGVGDVCDNCPDDANADQKDGDDDGIGDVCDNCPDDANPGQEDCNDDAQGDVCDPDPGEGDLDADGVCDGVDPCTDVDGDGWGQDVGNGIDCPEGTDPDCDDGNADVNPGAVEICDDLEKVDEDCDGASNCGDDDCIGHPNCP